MASKQHIWASIESFRNDFPNVEVLENVKFVDEGHTIICEFGPKIICLVYIAKNLLGARDC